MLYDDIQKFKDREIKAREIFEIRKISKDSAYEFVRKYHYLGDAKFFCVQAFGLFYKPTNMLVGCATFSLPQGKESLIGWFSLDAHTENIYELSRLCMLPQLNGTNATSFLLGGSIRLINNQNQELQKRWKNVTTINPNDCWICRAVITLALAERHVGSIYQVCNFKYYGMTDTKSDFYRIDGAKNPRGKVSQWHEVWIPRPRKHRYAYILDDSLRCNYPECERPSENSLLSVSECCHGTKEVYDSRFDEWYTCPICTGRLDRIYKDNNGTTIKIDSKNQQKTMKEICLW